MGSLSPLEEVYLQMHWWMDHPPRSMPENHRRLVQEYADVCRHDSHTLRAAVWQLGKKLREYQRDNLGTTRSRRVKQKQAFMDDFRLYFVTRAYLDDPQLYQYGLVEHWDTRDVTEMDKLFYHKDEMLAHIDIRWWNTSSLISAEEMFLACSTFNQDISGWVLPNLRWCSGMFVDCFAFNQPINRWQLSPLTTNSMFQSATHFNQPLDRWDMSGAINTSQMFCCATRFNQSLHTWDTSNVTNMRNMFENAHCFNQTVGTWNTANVTDMGCMFRHAHAFNQPLSRWDVSSVVNFGHMFADAYSFNQPLSHWGRIDIYATTCSMFARCRAFQHFRSLWWCHEIHMGQTHDMFEGCDAEPEELPPWATKPKLSPWTQWSEWSEWSQWSQWSEWSQWSMPRVHSAAAAEGEGGEQEEGAEDQQQEQEEGEGKAWFRFATLLVYAATELIGYTACFMCHFR